MPSWHLTASWGEQWTQESCVLGSGHNVASNLGTRELCPNPAATAWTGGDFQCRCDLLEGTLQREWDFTAMKIQKMMRPETICKLTLIMSVGSWDGGHSGYVLRRRFVLETAVFKLCFPLKLSVSMKLCCRMLFNEIKFLPHALSRYFWSPCACVWGV